MKPSLEQRFWSKVDIKSENECWNWTASKDTSGYGQIVFRGRLRKANRVVYHITHPDWSMDSPEFVCHTCDNRACCNPNHLWLGTIKDNTIDAWNKGRGVAPSNKGEKNPNAKLTNEMVLRIREQAGKRTLQSLAQEFGIGASKISLIIKGKAWKHVGRDLGPYSGDGDTHTICGDCLKKMNI